MNKFISSTCSYKNKQSSLALRSWLWHFPLSGYSSKGGKTKVLLFAVIFLFSKTVFGCSCSLGGVKQKLEEANSIFYGKVESINYKGTENRLGDKEILVTFSIKQSWKGNNKNIILDTAFNRVSCSGYWFEENEMYLIYAYEDNGKLDTYYCGGVFPDKDKEQFDNELKKINELSK
ncbi:MAG: hypothetical protein ACRBHB_15905 [Arenicella sp.]